MIITENRYRQQKIAMGKKWFNNSFEGQSQGMAEPGLKIKAVLKAHTYNQYTRNHLFFNGRATIYSYCEAGSSHPAWQAFINKYRLLNRAEPSYCYHQ